MKFKVGDFITNGYYRQIIMHLDYHLEEYTSLVISTAGHRYRFYKEPMTYIDGQYRIDYE